MDIVVRSAFLPEVRAATLIPGPDSRLRDLRLLNEVLPPWPHDG
jgi:hypothetical protein